MGRQELERGKTTMGLAISRRLAVASFHALAQVVSGEFVVRMAGHFGQPVADVSELARSDGWNLCDQRCFHRRGQS